MPIEIRELVIRAVVGLDGPPSPQPGVEHDGNAGEGAPAIDLDHIVQECVRQVMRVLARDRER